MHRHGTQSLKRWYGPRSYNRERGHINNYTAMRKIISETGLVMFQVGSGYAIGYAPTKQTLCIGSFSDSGLSDIFNVNELVFIRFVVNEKGLTPKQFYPEDTANYTLQNNEVRASIGNHFTQPWNFSTNTIKP